MVTYVRLIRSPLTEDLMKNRNAFMLLTQIAYRARVSDAPNFDDLKLGEALIGDHKSVGLSRQEYRTALIKLKRLGLITYITTNNGTIAKISNNRVYIIYNNSINQRNNQQETGKQPAKNQQVTGNKNVNGNEKEEFNNIENYNNGKFKTNKTVLQKQSITSKPKNYKKGF
jgi:hypothetical protein